MSNPTTPTEGQDKIDKILEQYANDVYSTAPDFHIAESMKFMTFGQAKQALKALIAKEIDVIIGDPLSEADGWEWNFSEEAKCCPGDDFAFYGNNIKDAMRQRAKERGWL